MRRIRRLTARDRSSPVIGRTAPATKAGEGNHESHKCDEEPVDDPTKCREPVKGIRAYLVTSPPP